MEFIALEDRFVALEMPNIVAVAMLLQNEDPSQSSFSLEESMPWHLPTLLSILPKHSTLDGLKICLVHTQLSC